MQQGFLAVETHRQRPNMVRLFSAAHSPLPGTHSSHQPQVRYVARFNDREAALMHAHEVLKRRLVDPDTHLYRASLEQAVAAVEAIELKHRQIYLDPDLDEGCRARIAVERERLQRIAGRKRRLFEFIGYIGIGLLLLNLFVLSFA